MPTTPAGTVYADKTFTSSKGYASTMLIPATVEASGAPASAVLYCHGSGAGDRSRAFSDASYFDNLKNALLDGGFMLVEGHVGGDHWGNQRGIDAYVALLQGAAAIHPINGVIPFGRSMGGTVASYLATQNTPIKPYVSGLYLQAGLQSLYWWCFKKGEAGTGTPGGPAAAYGITNQTSLPEFLTKTAGYDPLTFAPASFAGLPVLWVHGTEDTTVSMKDNSAAQRARVYPNLASGILHPVAGGDHSTGAAGVFGQTAAEMSFFNRCRGSQEIPISNWELTIGAEVHRVLDARLYDDLTANPLSMRVINPIKPVSILN